MRKRIIIAILIIINTIVGTALLQHDKRLDAEREASRNIEYNTASSPENTERNIKNIEDNTITLKNDSAEMPTPDSYTPKDQLFRTSTGTKYHRRGCCYLRYSHIVTDMDDIHVRNLGACSKCILTK